MVTIVKESGHGASQDVGAPRDFRVLKAGFSENNRDFRWLAAVSCRRERAGAASFFSSVCARWLRFLLDLANANDFHGVGSAMNATLVPFGHNRKGERVRGISGCRGSPRLQCLEDWFFRKQPRFPLACRCFVPPRKSGSLFIFLACLRSLAAIFT